MSDELKAWCEQNRLDFEPFKEHGYTLQKLAQIKSTAISVLAEELDLTSRERPRLIDAIAALKQGTDIDNDEDDVGLYDDPEVVVKGNDSGDYNEFETENYDDDDDDKKSLHEEAFMLRSNFSDDPADQWDIVDFFDKNEKFKKFKPILLLQMQIQNSANYNGNDGMGSNQNDQLDHLLDTMLGSGNQNDSSSDSDDDLYVTQPDDNTFREYINTGYMPSPASLIYDVVLNEYAFDSETSADIRREDDKSPLKGSVHYAHTLDYQCDLKDNKEHFISIGLDIDVSGADYARYPLNLVIVLETSCSMKDRYNNSSDSKQSVANNIVCCILQELSDSDKFCLVTFNDTFSIEQPLDDVKSIDMDSAAKDILSIDSCGGGCDFDEGFNAALGQLQELFDAQIMAAVNLADEDDEDDKSDEIENRVILITNNVPSSDSSLMDLMQVYSDSEENKIYTSFINIGDIPCSKLTNAVSKLRGCNITNYLLDSMDSVCGAIERGFNSFVNPIFFNVLLVLKSCKIDTVYGYHNNMKKISKLNGSGTVKSINSLFLNELQLNDNEEILEVITLRLQGEDDEESNIQFEISLSYEYRDGKVGQVTRDVVLSKDKDLGTVDDDDASYYDNESIRKRIVLIKYVELMNEWLARDSNSGDTNLNVSNQFKNQFEVFLNYLERQIQHIKDDTLNQEIEILNKLINFDAAQAEQWRQSNDT